MKRWYRVELNGNTVVSVRAVDDCGDAGACVFYVRAASEASASQAAMAQYARAYRAAFRELGRCVCGGERAPGYVSCVACRARHKKANAKRAEVAGTKPEKRAARPKAIETSRTAASAMVGSAAIRLAVLSEVEAAWMNNGTMAQFGKWLALQLEKLRGQRVA